VANTKAPPITACKAARQTRGEEGRQACLRPDRETKRLAGARLARPDGGCYNYAAGFMPGL